MPSTAVIDQHREIRARSRVRACHLQRGALVAVCLATAALAPEVRADGRADFVRYCAPCHGERGDGRGPMAHLLPIPPRDFSANSFKFRSTASGELPRTEDLLRVIEDGLPGTAMPGWRTVLPRERRAALVDEVKRLTPRFRGAPEPETLAVPPPTPTDAETISRGRQIWDRMQCAQCHGATGRGDGPAMPSLKDDRGRPIPPSNLTRADIIRRYGDADMARVLYTGLDGTPMPSYAEAFVNPAEVWDLVRYVRSLSRPTPWWKRMFVEQPLVARPASGGGP